MNRKTVVVSGVAVLVLATAAFAVMTGLGPLGGDESGEGEVPTADGTPDGASVDGAGSSDGSGETATPPPFELRIDSVESCGQTCRDVTATLRNNQERRATGVTVYTRIFAGNDTDGDPVWQGEQEIGTLDAGGSDTDTRRVDLGYRGALSVQREDGWVTIRLVVETDSRTVHFVERRDVI